MINNLFAFFDEKDVEYKRNEPMAPYTSVRIGGSAAVIAFPRTQNQLKQVMRYLYLHGIRHRVIGKMTNLLPLDEGYDGVLVCTASLTGFSVTNCLVTVEAGAMTSALIIRMARYNLGGLELLVGIPGTVGGMVASNAGAYGLDMASVLRDVTLYFPRDDLTMTLTASSLGFSYRSSMIKSSKATVLSARIDFKEKEADIIYSDITKIKEKRAETQPIKSYSLGSVFKRLPDGTSAAYLIDRCGLKGTRIGGASISEKHAGFIVNHGTATSQDFLDLVALARQTVREKFAVELETEIDIL
ncbi:MAG: UDP-N-acetylmuramate dehydrogenase [Clostridia bacterium]|nr:UDP-N-acetylmuramate dehydrogenase [Clostridia bacterium]